MKRAFALATILIGTVSLAACSTPYQTHGLRGGYSDTAPTSDTAIVHFNGNQFTSEKQAREMLLYRCAELTHQRGYDYFVITGDDHGFETAHNPVRTAATESYAKGITPSPADQALKYHQPAALYDPNTRLEADIKMFKGVKPLNDPHAYYANDLIDGLGPELGLAPQ